MANGGEMKVTHCGRCCRPLTICLGTCPQATTNVADMAALNSIHIELPARKIRRVK
jgi:hypothetical protein